MNIVIAVITQNDLFIFTLLLIQFDNKESKIRKSKIAVRSIIPD